MRNPNKPHKIGKSFSSRTNHQTLHCFLFFFLTLANFGHIILDSPLEVVVIAYIYSGSIRPFHTKDPGSNPGSGYCDISPCSIHLQHFRVSYTDLIGVNGAERPGVLVEAILAIRFFAVMAQISMILRYRQSVNVL